MKNVSKRKLKPGYRKSESKPTAWVTLKNKSRAGVKYTKMKEVKVG